MDQYERRQQEFEEASSPLELDRLFAKWRAEDLEAARAKTVERQRLDAMARRLHQLEAVVREMPAAVGKVVGRHVAKAIEDHPGMVYRGVWSATDSYPAGTVITDKSSAWVAITPAKPGERPSRATCWRLMAKGQAEGTIA